MTQNDVMQLLIGKDIGATCSKTGGNSITKYDDLADGEMTVVNDQNVVLSATTVLTDDRVALSGVKVLQRSGTKLLSSDLIKSGNLLTYKGVIAAAGTEQITYIGYNGTTGSIEVANSKLYVIRLSLKEQDLTGFGQEMVLNSAYKSEASATQAKIANGLALALANTLNRQTVRPVKPELLNSAAHFATARFANTATVVNGEKTVTCLTNTNYNTSVSLAVGDFVRIASSTTATATVGDGVYKVKELVSTTVFAVDRPIEATSGTYGAASTQGVITVLSASRAGAANFGMKLTGIARPFTAGKYRYSKVSFHVGLDSADSFGETPLTYSQKMSLGQGTYNQIAELEWELLGNTGDPNRADFLWTAHKTDATSGKTYNVVALTYYGDHPTGGVGATPRRMKQLMLAFENGYSTKEPPDLVVRIFDAYTTISSGAAVS